jgi:hypothetical protein
MSTAAAQVLQNTPNKLYLYVGVMDSFDGRKLQALRPDADGYFNGIPMSAFNAKSLNGCYYDTESYYSQLTNLNTPFNIRLTHGNLYGEWGHPKDDAPLSRVVMIDRDQESHHFKAVYTDKNAAGNCPIIRADIKCTGPKGKYLEPSLMNPHENTAFSLRCLMTERYDAALRAPVRTVEEFVTFDAVDMPGYLYGSKWYVEATQTGKECLMPITLDMLYTPTGKRVALESYNDERLLELFGVKNFDLDGKALGSYIKGTNTYRDPMGVNRSLIHSVLNQKRS